VVANLSGLDEVQATRLAVSSDVDGLYRLHSTDHRNKGQVAVAEELLMQVDYCTSGQLNQKAKASFHSLANLARG
jgi:flagellar basal body rod protein FlgF